MARSMASHKRYGRYELQQRLAVGGMAEIFLARELMADGPARMVVIKRLLPRNSARADLVQMLLDEGRIAKLLDHPNIVKVYEIGHHQGTHYLAMEWLVGWDLHQITTQTRRMHTLLPVPMVLRLMLDACRGLHAAHTCCAKDGTALNIIHRDVSPHNLFVTVDGVLKVLDFGIAKNKRQRHKTLVGNVYGKVAYFSPERWRDVALDPRADLFSLGTVFHELLTGKSLFGQLTPDMIHRALLEEPSPPPVRPGEKLDQAVVSIVNRARQRDRELRYPTAQCFAADIERQLAKCSPPPSASNVAALVSQLCNEEALGSTACTRWGETASEDASPVSTPPAIDTAHGRADRSEDLSEDGGNEDAPRITRQIPGRANSMGTPAIGAASKWRLFLFRQIKVPWLVPALALLVLVLGVMWEPEPEPQPDPAQPPFAGNTDKGAAVPVAPAGPAADKNHRPATKRNGALGAGRPRRGSQARGFGSLTLQAFPWANVYIDGRLVGPTPLIEFKVPAKKIKLRLVSKDTKTERHLSIMIPQGEHIKKTVLLR